MAEATHRQSKSVALTAPTVLLEGCTAGQDHDGGAPGGAARRAARSRTGPLRMLGYNRAGMNSGAGSRGNGLRMRSYLWLLVLLLLRSLVRSYGNAEGDALHDLKQALQDPTSVLQSWDPRLVNPCTWFHVTCDNENLVIRVDLGNAGLSGGLVPSLGRLAHLQYLELFSNNISGPIPPDLGNLTNLVSLDLYQNNFSSTIPNTIGALTKLRFLRLNNNNLSGSIPVSLTNLDCLEVLDLSNNSLSGEVPSNGSFSSFTPISFENNTLLCGQAVGKQCPGGPPLPPKPKCTAPPPTAGRGSGGSSGASTGAIAGERLHHRRRCSRGDD